jgi:hypothetical protein
MSRLACTLLLAAALPAMACSKSTESAGGAPAPTADLATPEGLTNLLTSKLGISESQATAGLGAVLSQAKTKLSPEDYAKLSGAIPGADTYLAAAAGAGAGAPSAEVVKPPAAPAADSMAPMPAAGADSIAAGAAEAAAGQSAGMSALNSAFSKIGLPPEAASQFVPVLTDYVGKVGGPDAANVLKGLF